MDMIPYTIKEHEDTGLYSAKFGVWLFLASEVMLFGALFSAYIFMRIGAAPGAWPLGADVLNVPMGATNTVILIGSSVTVVLAWAALKANDFSKFKQMLGITLLCSLLFMVIKSIEYYSKFSHGIAPSTNTYYAIYFTMTGLHALHVIGGLIVLGYFWGPGAKMWKTQPDRFTNRIEVAGLYWHFVDLVWIFLFPVLYLL